MIDKDFDFFEEIEKGKEKFNRMGDTFITGDFNSRTAQLLDILLFDKYLDDDDDDDTNISYKNTKMRRNKDHVIDNNGKKLVALCKVTDHIIANGRLCNDLDGNYTFISVRCSRVTNYLILNKYDINLVHDFKILDFSNFSDHAPIYFIFLTKIISNNPANNDTKSKFEQKIVFDEEKIAEYKETLKQNLDDLNSCITSETSVNMHAETLTNFLHENAIKTFGKNITIKTKNNTFSPQAPNWFNPDCHRAKQEFKTARNIFNRNRTIENRMTFVKTRTKYNRVRQKAKICFQMNEGQRHEKIAKSQPRKFWKSLKNVTVILKITQMI